MSGHMRFIFLSGVFLFVLLASLACPRTVFAEDGTPPPQATDEPAQPAPVDEQAGETPPANDAGENTAPSEEETAQPPPAEENVGGNRTPLNR